MSYQFLVYRDSAGNASLCEGGVYSSDSALLARVLDYFANTFSAGAAERDRLNMPANGEPYALVESMEGVALDPDAASSLVGWQLDAIQQSEGVTLAAMAETFRQRGRLAIADAPDDSFLILNIRGEVIHGAANAYSAQCLAGEQSAVWHKPAGQRAYELDAIRLQSLVDIDSGRAMILEREPVTGALAELGAALRDCYDIREGDAIADSVAKALGRAAREVTGEVDSGAHWHAEARDATERSHKLAARNAMQETTIRTYWRELGELRGKVAKQAEEIEAYRMQRDSEGAKGTRWKATAVAAETEANAYASKLANYRALMAALPLGLALDYPAALPLLRAFLADQGE